MTKHVKTAISLPADVFRDAERLAATLGLSRSQLYARALKSFVDEANDDDVTARLNAVYDHVPTEPDPALQAYVSDSLRAVEW